MPCLASSAYGGVDASYAEERELANGRCITAWSSLQRQMSLPLPAVQANPYESGHVHSMTKAAQSDDFDSRLLTRTSSAKAKSFTGLPLAPFCEHPLPTQQLCWGDHTQVCDSRHPRSAPGQADCFGQKFSTGILRCNVRAPEQPAEPAPAQQGKQRGVWPRLPHSE